MKKNVVLSFLTFIAFSYQAVSQADTRYHRYCVTTPSDAKTVFVYTDLTRTYDAKRGTRSVSPIQSAFTYSLVQGAVPAIPNDLEKSFVSRRFGSPQRVTGFEDFMTENIEQMQQVLFPDQNAKIKTQLAASLDTIIIKAGVSTLFSIPYVELDQNNKMPFKVLRANSLVFNGQPVKSVVYYDCGQQAD